MICPSWQRKPQRLSWKIKDTCSCLRDFSHRFFFGRTILFTLSAIMKLFNQCRGFLLSVLLFHIMAAAVPSASLHGRQDTNSESCTYSSVSQIQDIFNNLAADDDTRVFANVASNVTWVVEGMSPLAGIYSSKFVYYVNVINRLVATVLPASPHSISITNVTGGCDQEWSTQGLHLQGTCKNGRHFHFPLVLSLN